MTLLPTCASAPAKLILCGEHAVVYGRPAIALPLSGVRARVEVVAGPSGSGIIFDAPDLDRRWSLEDEPDDPLSALVAGLLADLAITQASLRILITSEVPIASGMGSGAAVATALVRAVAQHFGYELAPSQVATLVYESERRLHGTPSGIDNTVVAWEQPIWFVRPPADTPMRIHPITIAAPFELLIGDTGLRSATRLPVGEVRRRWQVEPARYEALFDQIALLSEQAHAALAEGTLPLLGSLLNMNHTLLQQIGVSSPELDTLTAAARQVGALGAKLSGAGWGGVMMALVTAETRASVRAALYTAGAARVLETLVERTPSLVGIMGD